MRSDRASNWTFEKSTIATSDVASRLDCKSLTCENCSWKDSQLEPSSGAYWGQSRLFIVMINSNIGVRREQDIFAMSNREGAQNVCQVREYKIQSEEKSRSPLKGNFCSEHFSLFSWCESSLVIYSNLYRLSLHHSQYTCLSWRIISSFRGLRGHNYSDYILRVINGPNAMVVGSTEAFQLRARHFSSRHNDKLLIRDPLPINAETPSAHHLPGSLVFRIRDQNRYRKRSTPPKNSIKPRCKSSHTVLIPQFKLPDRSDPPSVATWNSCFKSKISRPFTNVEHEFNDGEEMRITRSPIDNYQHDYLSLGLSNPDDHPSPPFIEKSVLEPIISSVFAVSPVLQSVPGSSQSDSSDASPDSTPVVPTVASPVTLPVTSPTDISFSLSPRDGISTLTSNMGTQSTFPQRLFNT